MFVALEDAANFKRRMAPTYPPEQRDEGGADHEAAGPPMTEPRMKLFERSCTVDAPRRAGRRSGRAPTISPGCRRRVARARRYGRQYRCSRAAPSRRPACPRACSAPRPASIAPRRCRRQWRGSGARSCRADHEVVGEAGHTAHVEKRMSWAFLSEAASTTRCARVSASGLRRLRRSLVPSYPYSSRLAISERSAVSHQRSAISHQPSASEGEL